MAAPKHLCDTRLRTARLESRPFPQVFSLSLLSVSGISNFTAAEPLFADCFLALLPELQAVRQSRPVIRAAPQPCGLALLIGVLDLYLRFRGLRSKAINQQRVFPQL